VYETLELKTLPGYGKMIAGFFSKFLETYPRRFDNSHGSLYAFACFVLLMLFVLDKLSGLCTESGTGVVSRTFNSCCCCMKIEETDRAFSTDIFHEISPSDLENEYRTTMLLREETEDYQKEQSLTMFN